MTVWKRCLVAPLALGVASGFNLLLPEVARVVPYMSFHLAAPVVAWFSRSLRCSWVAVLASAILGNALSMEPRGTLTSSRAALGASAAFILIQGAFTLSVVLLRRRMEDRELLLGQVRTER
ncbi:MAG TPA: DUF4118 domain-containing protein, partial [Myxococcaceae bacterium]|nr:DUF4118 domain-containing protein [Myxococcaceae bacterium]